MGFKCLQEQGNVRHAIGLGWGFACVMEQIRWAGKGKNLVRCGLKTGLTVGNKNHFKSKCAHS